MSSVKDYIIHNDHHLVMINKPGGVPLSDTQADGAGLLSRLQAYVKRDLFQVNRIDTPVSGLMVFAKNKEAAAHLSQQFKDRSVSKLYLAVTRERGGEDQGTWKDEIKQLDHLNKSVPGQGKEATAEYWWIKSLDHVHLYLLKPGTGRHHQLRVQMAEHIAPIRGDQKYGDKRGNRDRAIDLHSWALRLKHPSTNEVMTFEASLPDKAPWKYFELEKSDFDVKRYI